MENARSRSGEALGLADQVTRPFWGSAKIICIDHPHRSYAMAAQHWSPRLPGFVRAIRSSGPFGSCSREPPRANVDVLCLGNLDQLGLVTRWHIVGGPTLLTEAASDWLRFQSRATASCYENRLGMAE